MLLQQLVGRGLGGCQPGEFECAVLAAVQDEGAVQLGEGRGGVAVALAPMPVVTDQAAEGGLVDVAPVPFCFERLYRGRRFGQQPGGIGALSRW